MCWNRKSVKNLIESNLKLWKIERMCSFEHCFSNVSENFTIFFCILMIKLLSPLVFKIKIKMCFAIWNSNIQKWLKIIQLQSYSSSCMISFSGLKKVLPRFWKEYQLMPGTSKLDQIKARKRKKKRLTDNFTEILHFWDLHN